MRRRHRWLVLLGAAAFTVAVVLYTRPDRLAREPHVSIAEPPTVVNDVQPGKPKPCRETFADVVKGMTLEQATAVVGAGPGVYVHGELGSDVVLAPRGLGYSGYVRWVADDAELLVSFTDEAGHPIPPEAVRKDDRIFEVRVWDVWNLKR